MEPSQTTGALLFNSGAIPTSVRSRASSSKYSIAISFVQHNPLFSETLCCDFGFSSGCGTRNLRKKERNTFLMARACFAFTLSGMYLYQLPTPFFFSQLRFCQALKILSTTPATCWSFRPWQAWFLLMRYLTKVFSSWSVRILTSSPGTTFLLIWWFIILGSLQSFRFKSAMACSPCSCSHDNMPQLSWSPPSSPPSHFQLFLMVHWKMPRILSFFHLVLVLKLRVKCLHWSGLNLDGGSTSLLVSCCLVCY